MPQGAAWTQRAGSALRPTRDPLLWHRHAGPRSCPGAGFRSRVQGLLPEPVRPIRKPGSGLRGRLAAIVRAGQPKGGRRRPISGGGVQLTTGATHRSEAGWLTPQTLVRHGPRHSRRPAGRVRRCRLLSPSLPTSRLQHLLVFVFAHFLSALLDYRAQSRAFVVSAPACMSRNILDDAGV